MHFLPFLLNKTKSYKEAVKTSKSVLKNERKCVSKVSVTLMETQAELAKALYWKGDGSSKTTEKIIKASVK